MEQKKSIRQLLKATVTQWIEDQPFQLASSLSYYTPLFCRAASEIDIAIAGFAFGRAAAEQQIVGTIEGMIGQQSAEAVQGMIRMRAADEGRMFSAHCHSNSRRGRSRRAIADAISRAESSSSLMKVVIRQRRSKTLWIQCFANALAAPD